MEKGATKEPEKKIAAIKALNARDGGKRFDEIHYTLHELRRGEIIGTGSNHYEVQVAAERHFEGRANVILSKFDVNMKLDKDGKLLQEIEAVWCSVDKLTRKGITFMPNIYWSADVPDVDRTLMEKIASFGMCSSTCIAPFSMAFVSGSLEGICAGGYTPPSLLSEDELAFTKKQALIPHPRTYRLCSVILKVFVSTKKSEEQKVDEIVSRNKTFGWDFMDKKLKRWFIGWLEVQYYLLTWILCRCCLHNVGKPHPPVRNPLRAFGAWLLCFLRMYLAFVIPLSAIPMELIWTTAGKQRDYKVKHLGMLQYYGEMLLIDEIFFWSGTLLNIVVMIRVMMRMYSSCVGLKFHWSSLFCFLIAPLAFVYMPMFILWTFLKHGVLNMPAGHTVVTPVAKLARTLSSRSSKNGEKKHN